MAGCEGISLGARFPKAQIMGVFGRGWAADGSWWCGGPGRYYYLGESELRHTLEPPENIVLLHEKLKRQWAQDTRVNKHRKNGGIL